MRRKDLSPDHKVIIDNCKSFRVIDCIDESYTIKMRIMQRGEKEYKYTRGNDFVTRDKHVLYLLPDVFNQVVTAINDFDKTVNEAKSGNGYNTLPLINGITLYYKIEQSGYMGFITTPSSVIGVHKYDARSLFIMVNSIIGDDYSLYDVENHPIYIAADKCGDKRICDLYVMCFGEVTNEFVEELSEQDGQMRLPKLSEEYNRDYAVIADGIDKALLHRSGYRFCHRPVFGMQNCTRANISINPYTKQCIDAAKVEAKAITFDEFLALFNQDSSEQK